MWEHRATLLLTRADVRALLDLDACIDAVEAAFRAHADGASLSLGVLGTHVPGGGFHVKTAGLMSSARSPSGRAYYAAKVNANFPANPAQRGLPTIQGVIALHDAEDGRLLALLDSMEITTLRTAAATAVAAPMPIDRPPASQPITKPAAGTVASSAARRPPSRSASDSSATPHPPPPWKT
jgi:ornithine cyclodeaminase/alanine dehydrogenase-like protein (mu-crystallin family)